MTRAPSIGSYEMNEIDENKVICNGFDCQEEATQQLDLPFGEYGSTLFFFCKKCKEKIENMEHR